jgi:malate dehydrogenase (oxaloacetate-decarboxylating)
LIAVISDGSAVLGLGNIGPEGAIPVMEGKALLFKELAGVDAFPLCLATQDVQEIVAIVKALTPTFGGINLEDISAPRCFEIERQLMDIGIPVFHDDQHGTAAVVLAALINAAQVVDKAIQDLRVVICGAGAGGIATARMLLDFGVSDVVLIDSQGIVHQDRNNLNSEKRMIATVTNPRGLSGDLSHAMKGADVFVGLSVAGIAKPADVASMAPGAIVFAMANPVPEIMPNQARDAGAVVVGTGRSDFPNQINNSLVFPGMFRGALDARATKIIPEMKVAAAQALAAMVPEPTAECILPTSLDRQVAVNVGRAVADAWKLTSRWP